MRLCKVKRLYTVYGGDLTRTRTSVASLEERSLSSWQMRPLVEAQAGIEPAFQSFAGSTVSNPALRHYLHQLFKLVKSLFSSNIIRKKLQMLLQMYNLILFTLMIILIPQAEYTITSPLAVLLCYLHMSYSNAELFPLCITHICLLSKWLPFQDSNLGNVSFRD